MDERTPAPGESLSSPTAMPSGSAGYGYQQQMSGPESGPDFGGTHGREDIRRMGGAARRRLISEADRRKGAIASRLEQLADSLENSPTSGPEGKLIGSAASFARNASSQLRNRSSEDLLSSLEQGFRDRPGVALAGCVALGFIGGRLLRG